MPFSTRFPDGPNPTSLFSLRLWVTITVVALTILSRPSPSQAYGTNPHMRACRQLGGQFESIATVGDTPVCNLNGLTISTLSLLNWVQLRSAFPNFNPLAFANGILQGQDPVLATSLEQVRSIQALKVLFSHPDQSQGRCGDLPFQPGSLEITRTGPDGYTRESHRVCYFQDGSLVSESLFMKNETSTELRRFLQDSIHRLTTY